MKTFVPDDLKTIDMISLNVMTGGGDGDLGHEHILIS